MDDASKMLEHLVFQKFNFTNAITSDCNRKINISFEKKKQTNSIYKKEKNKELNINFSHDSLSLSHVIPKTYEWEEHRT
jgi:hypothetical protein